jgi:Cu/Ag efflux pump CusA
VRNFGAHIGQGTLADEPYGMNFAENWISIDKSVDYDKTYAAVNEVVDGYPGLQRDVQTYLKERTKEVLSGAGHGIVVHQRRRPQSLREKAEEVNASIADIDGIGRHYVELVTEIPQIQVEVDLVKASSYGIKPGDVRRTVSAFIASEEAGDIWRDGKNIEVHVWSVPKSRNGFNSVGDLMLDAWNGSASGSATWQGGSAGAQHRARENGSRRIGVHIDVKPTTGRGGARVGGG